MTQSKRIAWTAGLVALGALAVAAAAAQVQGVNPMERSISVTRVETLSAGDDGTAWALTTDGKLLHCSFDTSESRVRCFGRDGEASSTY